MKLHYSSVLTLILVAGCATDPTAMSPPTLSLEHYKAATSLTTSQGDKYIQFSTEKGYVEPYASPREFTATYLLASVDRNTGQAGYVLNVMASTTQPSSQATVSYAAPEGWLQQTVKVKHGTRHCVASDCWQLESVAVVLPEALLRTYARQYLPQHPGVWSFKIAPATTGAVSYAEIAGLLARVDDYRATLNLAR
jgi:hypothetical protein